MTLRYILVQLIGLCGTLLFFFSYQCKSNRRLFQVQFASYVFYTAHLLLLGAVTGGISYVINIFRSFCLGAKWKFGKSRAMCALICLAQLLALALTWGGWISILPVAAKSPRPLRAIPITRASFASRACLSIPRCGSSTT